MIHPENRKLGFVGDFINRGPQSVEVLNLVKSLHEEGTAVAVLGNHEFRLIQDAVAGRKVPSEYEPFLPWLRTLLYLLKWKPPEWFMPFGTFHRLIYWKEKKFQMMLSFRKRWKKRAHTGKQ